MVSFPTLSEPGRVLAYSKSTTLMSGITNTPTNITDLSAITFDVSYRPVEVKLFDTYAFSETSAALARYDITDENGVIKGVGVITTTTAFAVTQPTAIEIIETPGRYTRKGMIYRSGASGTVGRGLGILQAQLPVILIARVM